MNQKTLLVLRIILGVIGLAIAGVGLRISSQGGQGGTYTWVGIGLTFVAAFLLIARATQKK
ncbi:MAG TPA: hypothetical protein PLK30_14920 [Blastocatellia bacterium]|nr:hypothetical protein [Blastocatellia bacterium]